jgi:hypothetical protein
MVGIATWCSGFGNLVATEPLATLANSVIVKPLLCGYQFNLAQF